MSISRKKIRMNKQLLLLAASALLLSACASSTTSSAPTAEVREERTYRTGSNLPVRDPVSSSPTTTASPAQPGTGPRTN